MDIRLPNGVLVKGIPDGTSREEVMARAISSGLATAEDFGGTSAQKVEQEPSNVNAILTEQTLPEDTSAVTGRILARRRQITPEERAAENLAIRQNVTVPLLQAGLGIAAAPVLGAGAGLLGLTRLSPVISSAGFSGAGGAALPVGQRLLGGAIAGAGGGAAGQIVSPEVDLLGATETGAEIGGAVSVVTPPVVKQLAKGAGWLYDAISGKLGQIKAAKIARDVAGGDINAIKAANLAASEGETAGQAAADIGNDTWSALDRLARTSGTGSWWSRRLDVQEAEIKSALSRLAGGTTPTESRAVQEASKRALNEITTPMREAELARAGIAGRELPGLVAEKAAFEGAAAANVDEVRKLADLSERASFWAKNWGRGEIGGKSTELGLPRVSGKYGYPEGLVNFAEQKAIKSAEESLRFGEMTRDVQKRIDDLSKAGLQPLKTDDLISKLSAKLSDPDIGLNRDAAGVIDRVNKMLSGWTDRFGSITPEALYAIRKNGVSDAIAELNPGATESTRKKLAASVAQQIKPLIDDAIVNAGGSNWGNYLKTFENGMKAIEQKEMAEYARNLYSTGDKKGFVDLVKGNNPSAVEDVFGPGRFDFIKEMGGQRPKSPAVEFLKLAESVEKSLKVEFMAEKGGQRLVDILSENQSKLLGIPIPPILYRPVTIIREALKDFEGKVNRATFKALESAMQSGKSANELLSILPTSERNKVLNVMSNSQLWNPVIQRGIAPAIPAIQAGGQGLVDILSEYQSKMLGVPQGITPAITGGEEE